MVKTTFKSVDDYLASQPEAAQRMLRRFRTTIREELPEADEVISYQIPTYKMHSRAVLYFAGWKQHCSLYPVTARLKAALKDELAPYEVQKGTIRFPLTRGIPVKLIARIARFRAREVSERKMKTKPAKAKR